MGGRRVRRLPGSRRARRGGASRQRRQSIAQEAQRHGFRILDGDFDCALGSVEEVGGTLTPRHHLVDCRLVSGLAADQCPWYRQIQQLALIKARVV